jgi:hypothetical protein
MKNPFRSILLAFSFLIAPLCAQDAPRTAPPSVSAQVIVKNRISQPEMTMKGKIIVQGTERLEGYIVSDARIEAVEKQKKSIVRVKVTPAPTLQRKTPAIRPTSVPTVRKEVIEPYFVDQVHVSPIEYFVIGLPRSIQCNQVIRGRFIRIANQLILNSSRSKVKELPAYRFVSASAEIIEIRKTKK